MCGEAVRRDMRRLSSDTLGMELWHAGCGTAACCMMTSRASYTPSNLLLVACVSAQFGAHTARPHLPKIPEVYMWNMPSLPLITLLPHVLESASGGYALPPNGVGGVGTKSNWPQCGPVQPA